MEYFALQYDRQIIDLLKLDKHDIDFTTTEPFILPCEMEETITVPEFFIIQELFTYHFFISDRLKELFDVYHKDFEAVPCFLTDTERQRQECFWKIKLPEIYQEKQEGTTDVYLVEEQAEGKYVFTLVIEKRKYIIVSLHLAEHMLRKNCYGIRYNPVELL